MAKLLRLRRGTSTQHTTFTGAEGEVTVDTTKDTLVVHDNATVGGRALAREDLTNVSSATIAGRLAVDSLTTDKLAAGALPTDVTVASANIVDGTIVNADISTSAAIANSKLATSGVTAGTYGSSSAIPAITVNDRGIVTAASTTAIDSTAIANGSTNVTAETNRIDFDVSGTNHAFADSTGLFLRNQYDLKFGDADSSHYVAFQAPSTVGTSLTWTLPGADGQDRQVIATNGGGVLNWSNLPAVTSSSTAPVNPKDNDLWYDTDDGRLYFRYNDGTSTQWVDASPEGGAGSNEFNTLRLNGTNNGWTQLEAPANAGNTTFRFPANSGANNAYLQTDGAGNTNWATITQNTSTLTRGTAQALNGTSGVEFTGVPAQARKITIMFNGASTTGNDAVVVRLGSGALASSGYSASWSYSNSGSTGTGDVTNGIPLANGDASYAYYGTITLTNVSGNTWLGSGVLLGDRAGNAVLNGAGWITLGGTIDRVGVAVSAGTFDAGSVNILIETE